jgi:hypothetical protein
MKEGGAILLFFPGHTRDCCPVHHTKLFIATINGFAALTATVYELNARNGVIWLGIE